MRAFRERPAAVFRYSSSVTDRSNFAEGSYVGIEAANADRTSTDERSGSAPAPTTIALRKSRRSRAWAVMATSCEALSPGDQGRVAVSILLLPGPWSALRHFSGTPLSSTATPHFPSTLVN